MHIVKQFFSKYQLPILSGVFIGTSYIPFPPWAVLFAFVPLWYFALNAKSFKQIFIGGWITQYVLTLIGFNWVSYTIHEFGGMPWPVAIIGLLLFCAIANLYIPIALSVWYFLQKKISMNQLEKLLLLAFATALFEMADWTLFKWNFGYTWYWVNFPLFQLAEYIGFQGISSIMILLNVLAFYFWKNRKNKVGRVSIAALLLIFSLMNILGHLAADRLERPDSVVRPMIVQANISNQQKVYAEQGLGFREYIIQKFKSLSSKQWFSGGQYPDFAIWPETAFPDFLNLPYINEANQRMLTSYLADQNMHLITGAYAHEISTDQTANAMFFLDDKGQPVGLPYYKNILLAFGEYIPGSTWFPWLKKLLPMVADFKRGAGPTVKEFKAYKIGAQICYESLFPRLSRDLADKGAQFIVNVTNDSWYGHWQEPYQHLYMTLGRAIEFRRPVIRSTNTGISTVALASGEVLAKSPLDQEWAHTYLVPFIKSPRPTFYQSYFLLIPGLILLAFLAIPIQAWLSKSE